MRSFYRFIVITILLISSTCASLADGNYKISGFSYWYNTENKTAILSSLSYSYGGDINVPEKINIKGVDYTIVAIGGKCFQKCRSVTSITLPNTITSLGSYCFTECEGLKKVNIPSSVKEIGEFCFDQAGIENIEIPSSVTALPDGCFNKSALKSIILPETITILGESCFAGSHLETIKLPSSISIIGNSCFKDCLYLKNIDIPQGVMNLENTFENCENLEKVTLSKGVSYLYQTFLQCKKLKTINIPEGATYLIWTFVGCSSLENITIPEGVIEMSGTFVNCERLRYANIPKGVTNLTNAFGGCSSLENITIPEGVIEMSGTFVNCERLRNVNIPQGVANLERAFSGCSSLENITIPEGVTNTSGAFDDCSSLASVTISNGVTLSGGTFGLCFNLKNVILEGKVKVKPEEFCTAKDYFGVPLESCTLYVPKNYLQEYQNSNFWKDFGKILPLNDYKPTKTCETPSVSFSNGEINFRSNTSGARYHYTISTNDETSTEQETTGRVKLNAYYNIKVYATADGYEPSSTATATLYWLNGSIDMTNINNAKTRGIAVSSEDGFIRISGLSNRETVSFYSLDGKYLGRSQATDGIAIFSVSENLIIAKIGTDSIKIKTK